MSDSDDSSNGIQGEANTNDSSSSDVESSETASTINRSCENETVELASDKRKAEDIVMGSNCQSSNSNCYASNSQGNSINDSPRNGSVNYSISHGTNSVCSSSASGSVESFDKLATGSPTFKTEVATTSVRHLEIGHPSKCWQSSCFTPTERLNALLRHASHSDLTVGFPSTGKAYKVHRLVLAMSSPVLEDLLFGTASPPTTLELDHESSQAFKWLLANMYMGCRNLPNVEIAAKVYVLAYNYEMDAICNHCKEYLLRNVGMTDCQHAYHGAMVCGDAPLAARCAQIASGAWSQGHCASVCGLSRLALRHLFSQDRLCLARECELYEALVEWGRCQLPDGASATGADVREQVEDFLPLIRFLAMTPEAFLVKVSSSGVLTADECVSILMNIQGISRPLPTTFKCSARGPRETVFDDNLVQALVSCPHRMKKKSDRGDVHSKSFRQGLGFKLICSSSIHVKRIQISSGYLPRDGQFLLLDKTGKPVSPVIDGEFLGHQCICGKGQNPHSNLVSWTFDPPYLLLAKRDYLGKVRHSTSETQVEAIKQTLRGVTICGQITASPFRLDFFLS